MSCRRAAVRCKSTVRASWDSPTVVRLGRTVRTRYRVSWPAVSAAGRSRRCWPRRESDGFRDRRRHVSGTWSNRGRPLQQTKNVRKTKINDKKSIILFSFNRVPAHCGSMVYFSAPAHPSELHVAVSSARTSAISRGHVAFGETIHKMPTQRFTRYFPFSFCCTI